MWTSARTIGHLSASSSVSLVASQHPRLTLWRRAWSWRALVAGRRRSWGQLRSSRNRHAGQSSERTVPTIPMRTPPQASAEAGQLQGPVTSENYMKWPVVVGVRI
jgi:hypothetical protein